MKNYLNEPIEYEWTVHDIIREYESCQDKKKVARIWNLSIAEVNKIINGIVD